MRSQEERKVRTSLLQSPGRRTKTKPVRRSPNRKGVVLIIPARNEEATIGLVIQTVPKDIVSDIIVVDNGSTDKTSLLARAAGARVVKQPKPGYGSACLRGITALRRTRGRAPAVVAFMDADGSDRPGDLRRVIRPVFENQADLVIGVREGPGRLWHQRWGTGLACRLMAWNWRFRFHDLGPMRAVSAEALLLLDMDDRDYGWTAQMQARALNLGLRCQEVRVSYGPRKGGRSKVSGSLRGTLGASFKILWVIAREALDHKIRRPQRSFRDQS